MIRKQISPRKAQQLANQVVAYETELTQATHSTRLANILSEHLGDKVRVQRETLERIIEIIRSVAKYSVALEPLDRESSPYQIDAIRDGGKHQIGLTKPVSTLEYDFSSVRMESFETISLGLLETYLDAHSEAMQKASRFRLVCNDRQAACVITEQAFHSMPKARLVQDVARMLVEHLRHD